MKSDIIDRTIEQIAYLVESTVWGKTNSSKKMLQLVYEECRELGASLSNIDIENQLEEAADVNMMLIYFCCKQNWQLKDIKILFHDASHHQKTKQKAFDLYQMVLIYYGQLADAYEEGDERSEIYSLVGKISSLVLSIASIVGSDIDVVFDLILKKLRRRYPLFFGRQKCLSDLEEDYWTSGKDAEKDRPYLFCTNSSCTCYGKLHADNIWASAKRIACVSCGSGELSILLPQYNSKARRAAIEQFQKSLVCYQNGDSLIVNLYVFHCIEDVINIFTDFVCNRVILEEFVQYFSRKCAIEADVITGFLRSCFYQTFLFDHTDRKQRIRVDALRNYISNYPACFVRLILGLGVERGIAYQILLPAINYLSDRKQYNLDCCWKNSESAVFVDLRKKHSIFHVFLLIRKAGGANRCLVLENIERDVQIEKYKSTIEYFFLNDRSGIRGIIYEGNG